MNTAELRAIPWTNIEGTYVVENPRDAIDRKGRIYTSLRLKDRFGSISAYIWQDSIVFGSDKIKQNTMIRIRGVTRKFRNRMLVDIRTAETVGAASVKLYHTAPSLDSLNPTITSRLHNMTSKIESGPLREFLNDVFSDISLMSDWRLVPASLKYHHCYCGGLIEHSIECAEIVANAPNLPKYHREVGIVAALFHDIGKIKTMTPDMKRTELGKFVNHEALTTELLRDHLIRLETFSSTAAYLLRHTWSSMSAKYWAYKPAFPLVSVVKMADRISSETGKGEKTKKNLQIV